MNSMTETAEITTETTAFQRSVLRAMLELAGSNTSNEIAKQAGVKSEPVRVCLAKLRDAGLLGTEVNPDKGGPPLWHLRASVDTVRSMVAAPIPSANGGTPGDDEPAPEPGDTQAVEAAEPTLMSNAADLQPSVEPVEPVAETLATEADADGWIPWRGGECPVPADAMVEIKIRCGATGSGRADEFFWGWTDGGLHRGAIVAYRLYTPKHVTAADYSAAVAAESAADAIPPAGDDVCRADAVIANWKREHAPAAPTIATADPFAAWLKDTPAGCAGQRAIDAAEQEAARLRAEAAEMVREAAEALEFGLIVAEIIRFADQRNVSTSTADVEFGLAELLAAAYEAVTGKRVA